MFHLKRSLLSVLTLVASASISSAVLISNGNFTSGMTGYTTVGNTGTAPVYSAGGSQVRPTSGNRVSRMVSTGGVGVATMESTLGIPSGSLQSLSNSLTHPYAYYSLTNGSAIQTSFDGTGTLSFDWNFWREDYVPYNDISFFTISGPGITGTDVILLQDVNGSAEALASTTGFWPAGGTGWQGYNYTLPGSGTYTISFGVVNSRDTAVASYLHIDNIQASVLVPEAGTAMTAGLLAAAGLLLTLRRRRVVLL